MFQVLFIIFLLVVNKLLQQIGMLVNGCQSVRGSYKDPDLDRTFISFFMRQILSLFIHTTLLSNIGVNFRGHGVCLPIILLGSMLPPNNQLTGDSFSLTLAALFAFLSSQVFVQPHIRQYVSALMCVHKQYSGTDMLTVGLLVLAEWRAPNGSVMALKLQHDRATIPGPPTQPILLLVNTHED